ncbi:hypothetical protein D9M72_413100 [compost metagenome]
MGVSREAADEQDWFAAQQAKDRADNPEPLEGEKQRELQFIERLRCSRLHSEPHRERYSRPTESFRIIPIIWNLLYVFGHGQSLLLLKMIFERRFRGQRRRLGDGYSRNAG